MKTLWAIEPAAFEAFLKGVQLQIQLERPESVLAAATEDARRAGLPISRQGNLAIIHMAGPMMKSTNAVYRWFGFASTTDQRAAFRAALADEEVEQILWHVDSPGGTVDGTLELGEEVRKAALQKRVTVQSGGMIGSAAYWAASQANAIHAGRMDLVGSIGVRMMVYDFSKMFESDGVRAVPIDTGPFKSAGAMGTPFTAEQEAYFQALVDDHFGEFRRAVQTGRKMADSQFEAVGDGRVFTTPAALELGLIDRVQGIDETVSSFRQQAVRKARLALSMTA